MFDVTKKAFFLCLCWLPLSGVLRRVSRGLTHWAEVCLTSQMMWKIWILQSDIHVGQHSGDEALITVSLCFHRQICEERLPRPRSTSGVVPRDKALEKIWASFSQLHRFMSVFVFTYSMASVWTTELSYCIFQTAFSPERWSYCELKWWEQGQIDLTSTSLLVKI